MKKIELIWREILERGVVDPTFEQQALAKKFRFSTSTVFAAVSPLRAIGAVAVTGRNFRVTDFEKILMFWATHRNLSRDIIYQTHVNLPVSEIEGLVDNETTFAAYSAARLWLGQAPADYDKVYVYAQKVDNLTQRFPAKPGRPNFFVLQKDEFLAEKKAPVSQTFVDLWNLSDWFAADYLKALTDKFYGFLQ